MKKLFKFLFTVLMVLSLTSPVYANDDFSSTNSLIQNNQESIELVTTESVLIREVKIFIAGYLVSKVIDGIVYKGTGYYPQDITDAAIAAATDFALYNIYQHVALSSSILADFSNAGVFISATGGFGGGGGTTWSFDY